MSELESTPGARDMTDADDRYEVHGTDKYGEPFRSWEESLDMAQHVAGKINGRGGSVAIKRLVWCGPAATWLPEDHYKVRRLDS